MRIVLGIEYDGAGYSGWQLQHGTRTVQGEVEAALAQVADHPLRVSCAGRTDTGVHALQQVVHFDSDAVRSERSWVLGGNANLADEISIRWAQSIDDGFHARFSAIARSYRYVIYNAFARPALLRKQVCWRHGPLDEQRMNQACEHLLGEHDFTSYRALACQASHAVRTIEHLSVSRKGEYVYIDIRANAFLYHMVRNIAGVLISIGQGEQSTSWSAELLAARDRSVGGVTARAAGLYFLSAHYPERYKLPAAPEAPFFS
ncbi:MAG TPA: tRNA pseudouridine(38-40) synthase TruA [Gammaproteobacteria bacterium]|nr:tRNA pseudouridine(38-40) synthase TruA [Gammaproteobacteria bacterium]